MHRLSRNMLQQSTISFRYFKIRVLNFGYAPPCLLLTTTWVYIWVYYSSALDTKSESEYIIRIIIRQPSAVVIFEQPKSRKVTLYSMFKEKNWWRAYILPWLSNGRKIFNICYIKTEPAKNSISESFFNDGAG